MIDPAMREDPSLLPVARYKMFLGVTYVIDDRPFDQEYTHGRQ